MIRTTPWVFRTIAMLAALSLTRCATRPPQPPRIAPSAGSSSSASAAGDAEELQSVVMMMSDDWNTALGESMFTVQSQPQTDLPARIAALTFLRNGMSSSLDIAVGPNPRVAMLDLLVLSALQEWAMGKNWPKFGMPREAIDGVLQRLAATRHVMVEKAGQYLTPAQLADLQRLIDAWIAANPDQVLVSFVRFSDFVSDRKRMPQADRDLAGGLLREVGEVTMAVDDARVLGERAMWYASRYPFVLGQQAELTSYKMTSAIAREIAAQREAFFDRVAQERAAVIHELDEHRASVTPVIAEARETIHAARELSAEVTRLVAALDALAARFDHHDERDGLTVQDVKDLLRETGASADKLTALVHAGDAMLEARKLNTAEQEASQFGLTVVNRLLWGGAGLVAMFIGGLALLRRIPQRLPPR